LEEVKDEEIVQPIARIAQVEEVRPRPRYIMEDSVGKIEAEVIPNFMVIRPWNHWFYSGKHGTKWCLRSKDRCPTYGLCQVQYAEL
jgi:hypothetical protein